MNLNQYETILLDCDGVIFNSNLLKVDAFRSALREYDRHLVNDFIDFFKLNFGISRYVLARHFIENILNIEFNKNVYQEILTEYSKNCEALYQNAEFTPALLEFLEFYRKKRKIIISGNNQAELRNVFRLRNIEKYFDAVYGSPKTKKDLINELFSNISKNPLSKCATVMIGDAESDYLASKDNNIDFIFMRSFSTNNDIEHKLRLSGIDNLGELIE